MCVTLGRGTTKNHSRAATAQSLPHSKQRLFDITMASSNDNKTKKTPPPSFSGYAQPVVPTNVDDLGDEPTRRVLARPSFDSTVEPVGFQRASPHLAPPSFPNKSASPLQQDRTPGPQTRPQDSSAQSAGWTFSDVPTLPKLHPLERTAVFVPNVPAAEVASRVSNILRERSIEATYDDSKAKAKCMTADNVNFRVRLYRGRNQYSNGIIVEVQRRFGASVNFHNDTMAILDAAEGKVPRAPPPMAALPEVSDSEDDYDPSLSASSLDFVSKMFRHQGYDAHSLALQTLIALTDPAKMGQATSHTVSEALLQPDSEVGAKVVSLVTEKMDPEETFGLRLMAMTVLSNAIQAVSGSIPDSLREKLRPVFIDILEKASAHPQMAYLVAKCIEPIIQEDHNPSELYVALETALAAGDARHAALSRQAAVCLKSLESR